MKAVSCEKKALGQDGQQENGPLLQRFKWSDTSPNTIVRFNEAAGVRLSEDLYNIEKVRWSFGIFGYRALFAIVQSLDKSTWYNDVFIKQNAMFQYLGVDKSGQRYEILARALAEVRSTTITRRNEQTKKWEGFGFIDNFEFIEGGEYIHITVNEKAKPLLFELKQYVQIQPKIYLALKDEYQNWLYPMLKLRVGGRVEHFCRWEMSIEDIATALQLDKKQPNQGKNTRMGAYDKRNKDRVGNILKNVLGIRISDKAKEENRLAAVEKRKPKEVPWDYTTSRDGVPNGTLCTISRETDISVQACAVKVGRAYGKVIFFIDLKDEYLSARRRELEYKEIVTAADVDMGQRKPHNGGEVNLAQLVAQHVKPQAQTKVYSGKELLQWCRDNGIPGVRTVTQAVAVTHKKKIGADQYV
jgi:hypothetical protein